MKLPKFKFGKSKDDDDLDDEDEDFADPETDDEPVDDEPADDDVDAVADGEPEELGDGEDGDAEGGEVAVANGDGEVTEDVDGAETDDDIDEDTEVGPSLDDDEFDDDEDEEGGGAGLDKKLLAIVGVAAFMMLMVIGGGAWWFLGGDDSEGTEGQESGVPVVSIRLPPKGGGAFGGALTPPTGAAGVAGVAGVAGAAGRAKAGTLNAIGAAARGPGAGVVIPAMTAAAFATLPKAPDAEPLPPAPDQALVEQGAQGPLPKVAEDGRMAWKVYARPFDTRDSRPRIAIVVKGLGLSRAATEAAIRRLPASVTLAFDPYAKGLSDWVALARNAGHEVLVAVPLEPANFPFSDPGPQALLTSLDADQNLGRLEAILTRLSGYVGVMTLMGSKFNKEEDHVRPVLEAIKSRGLMYVDGSRTKDTLGPKIATEIGLPRAFSDATLDRVPSKASIDRHLSELENTARNKAVAVGLANALPATLERIVAWAATLQEKNLALAPISALADKQFLP